MIKFLIHHPIAFTFEVIKDLLMMWLLVYVGYRLGHSDKHKEPYKHWSDY